MTSYRSENITMPTGQVYGTATAQGGADERCDRQTAAH